MRIEIAVPGPLTLWVDASTRVICPHWLGSPSPWTRMGDDPMNDGQAQETVDVLRQVADWELAPPRWERVSVLLDAVQAALSSGDAEALAAALIDLEMAGPVRIVRIGSAQPSAPPPKIRERVNQLIHSLTASVGDDPTAEPGRDTGGERPAE
jgi:hypothetical protein